MMPAAGAAGTRRGSVEPVPDSAAALFGPNLPAAVRYAGWLASAGVERGLIGPREADRIWSRHLLNSAVVAELIPAGAHVVDVGSGAGLPGLPVALARPDLRITLLEPLLRRTKFLDEVVQDLKLGDRITVVRGRSEDEAIRRQIGRTGEITVVLARAVAPLDRLVRWCLPLLAPGGWLLALKGRSATEEVAAYGAAARQAGAVQVGVVTCGCGVVDPPTVVIRVQRGPREGRATGSR